jgi:hypothetical protein
MQMNSMAIVFQLVSRCYQHSDDLVKKKTLILAANYTLKALRDYLGKARSAHHLTPLVHDRLFKALAVTLKSMTHA